MINLVQLWNSTKPKKKFSNPLKQVYSVDTPQSAIDFDATTIQSSFEFSKSPIIRFVKNTSTLEPADFYGELPEVTLSSEENLIRLKLIEELEKNPHFYDGKQMLVTGVIYEESSNTLYLEAKKVPFSFMVALSNNKFPKTSSLYRQTFFMTGVLAPLITRDNKSLIMQRASEKLYSVPCGFLETKGDKTRLNFYNNASKKTTNLVIETAKKELKAELLGISGTGKSRFELSDYSAISSVSFNTTEGNPIGTFEFVAPFYADCHSDYLHYVFLHNLAEDADEHTLNCRLISLGSQYRDDLVASLLTGPEKLPGECYYLPAASAMVRSVNQRSMMPLSPALPNTHSKSFPLEFFFAKPVKPLSHTVIKEKEKQEAKIKEIRLKIVDSRMVVE